MALAYLIRGWDVEPWIAAIHALDPALDVRVYPDRMGKLEDIVYAVAWLPPRDVLKSLPNLKVIFSLGAGVDAIIADNTLPDVPIVRVIEPDLTMRMAEYVVMHVLMHHRQQRRVDENQRAKIWDSFPTHAASELTVGMLGFGVLGQDCALKLKHLGFRVQGYSLSRKNVPGVRSFAGTGELDAFLASSDILVVLLPSTKDTKGMVNRAMIRKLSRKGPFKAPILINAGRGKIHNEQDIIDCLNAGDLYACSLDVFEEEPLPVQSPLWSHPRAYVTPHLAADSDAYTITRYFIRQMRNHQNGLPLDNVIDRSREY